MLIRTIEARTHGRFLVEAPSAWPGGLLLVGFRGYGENAERHLEHLRSIPGAERWTLVSIQALHRFYAGRFEEVVACWMTRQDREQAIADNIAYVDGVMAALTGEYGTPVRLVYAGFSQGTAIAYRAAASGAAPADGVIALGGDLPPDVFGVWHRFARQSQDRDQPVSRLPRVLIGRGTRDTWYTDEKLQADLAQLRQVGLEVTTTVFDGGHGWTTEFRASAARFLESIAVTGPRDRPTRRSNR